MSQWDPDDDDLVDELPAPPRKSIPEADRELLELAARALGAVRVEDIEGEQWLNLHFEDGSVMHGWNPLVHSDDAFELAVRCQISFGLAASDGKPRVAYYVETDLRVIDLKDDFSDFIIPVDQLAATRRAVVRAAAEIGKAT